MAVIICITMKDQDMVEELVLEAGFIGRSSNCDFVVQDIQISARHGLFEINKAGQLIYQDLGSTNGSFLNGIPVTHTQIKINEILKIGQTLIKIHESKLTAEEHAAIGSGSPPLPGELIDPYPSSADFVPKAEKTGVTKFIKLGTKK